MSEIAYPAELSIEADLLDAAREIYPRLTETENQLLRKQYACAFANILGSPGEFEKYVLGNQGDLEDRRQRLLAIFRQNVGLLLGKTWVEDHDTHKKDDAESELASFTAEVSHGEYDRALVHLVNICDLIARLLFGEDPANHDFLDYVLRIDPKLGVFYWYMDQLRHPAHPLMPSSELAMIQLLLAIYALASY
ncbi:MAG: hypothetical protein A2087_04890 [Spirochaetes bacterium GWD1_61_31]|nr:MAG: hypothetical protein A2Y37_01570 [Spirochaetes bacterium GWB1_60_80]OHD34904.1 MAG: hypothetical protein A2004_00600 [Spirochaetes bacterium GWC1_61_12]OHD37067.1 MAG: hypothetical protein A2087_04890 [Spirochaetes bacterium GWD1_61_31]OHD44668.1 MAG: hypothetical protein A2Y35_11910 [Spirochaetes bacterium GWE1_60_18]OHD61075.1 MAG: hypothetical protein A2Y32_09185 [Spirochaetes bacterium GWF1_60_12]HAP42735.1 hypothetical protein [Spirochaetaceae bacterium]